MADVFTALDVVYGLLAAGALAMVAFAHRELKAAQLLIICAALLLSARWIMWSFMTDQPWPIRALVGAILGALVLGGLPAFYSWARERGQTSQHVGETAQPSVQVLFEPHAPYEVAEITNGRVLSTVRIGLKALGKPLSNCKVYIEKMAPQPPLPGGGFPMLLEGSGFILRPDDPEKLLDIASQWNHVTKFRFNAPGGWWAETMNYIDDDPPKVIEIKIVATELQKTFMFKLWVDEAKKIHLERM